MSFLAADDTRPGSLGAGASVWGLSEIIHVDPGFMRIIVNFSTGYYPSDFPSGDRPGGSAEGEMSSSVAFEMPADEIGWYYQLEIDDLPGFEGSSSVTVWNETQSVTLLHLTSERWFVETTLAGNTGDLIRVTSVMSGSGSGPPGLASYRHYLADLRMDFWIPEPSSLTLLCGGVLILTRRRSSVRCGRAFPGSASARRIGSAP